MYPDQVLLGFSPKAAVSSFSLWAVADGHNGAGAAQHCHAALCDELMHRLPRCLPPAEGTPGLFSPLVYTHALRSAVPRAKYLRQQMCPMPFTCRLRSSPRGALLTSAPLVLQKPPAGPAASGWPSQEHSWLSTHSTS